MSRLEDLQRELTLARRMWQWERVRDLLAQIAAENARLVAAADSLPEAPADRRGKIVPVSNVRVEADATPSIDPSAEKPAKKKRTRKKAKG